MNTCGCGLLCMEDSWCEHAGKCKRCCDAQAAHPVHYPVEPVCTCEVLDEDDVARALHTNSECRVHGGGR